ncbi:MAG TPA: heparan-alpha-glucosaminide N-acetyltransferase domain-containing protein, partial [Myxococcaceae bacterium]|nr:heparan-alpha-glucosaminide N-acetyltransferase domain-containing protein [Myxococcaceae bacterium]
MRSTVAVLPASPLTEALAESRRSSRVVSVDLIRGAAMVLMALDHVRYFITDRDFPPENLAHTTLPLFLTRWVTHFCAPAFFLLAGTGARLSLLGGRSPGEVASFLWRRGLLLVVLELTLVGFAWQFVPGYSFAGVIWCLGVSMILLAPAVRWLPTRAIGIAALVIIGLHDLTDPFRGGWLWSLLHRSGTVRIGGLELFVLFPLIPWVAVM